MLLKRFACVVPVLAACGFVAPAQAVGTLDLSLSDKILRVGFDAIRQDSPVHLSASWLHDKDKGDVATTGFHVVERKPHSQNLYLGVGAVAHYVNIDNKRLDKDISAVGVGGFFRYSFPQVKDLSLAGNFYYAPSVLAFSDSKNLINTDWRLQYSIIPSARIFLGYRYIGVKMDKHKYGGRTHRVGDGAHVGFSLDF